jgi:hypothetical protein
MQDETLHGKRIRFLLATSALIAILASACGASDSERQALERPCAISGRITGLISAPRAYTPNRSGEIKTHLNALNEMAERGGDETMINDARRASDAFASNGNTDGLEFLVSLGPIVRRCDDTFG